MGENRFKNQKGLINDDLLGRTRFVIVGAGAIGSYLAIALSKMGARRITAYDHDTIEDHNFANQFYPKSQLGKPKVLALKEACSDYGDCEITAINEPWTPDNAVECDVLVSAVDNMEVRAALWRFYGLLDRSINPSSIGTVGSSSDSVVETPKRVPFFLDGRMGPLVYKVYGVDTASMEAVKLYQASLHSQASGSQEKCGEKSIIFTVYQVAGQMCSQVKQWIMESDYRPTEVVYDCFNDEVIKQYNMERKIEVMEAEDEPETVQEAAHSEAIPVG